MFVKLNQDEREISDESDDTASITFSQYNNSFMEPSIKRIRFNDIVDKDKMIDQLRKSGRVQLRATFHTTTANIHKTYICPEPAGGLRTTSTSSRPQQSYANTSRSLRLRACSSTSKRRFLTRVNRS